MTSAIDITKPIYGTPTTQSVRDNFTTTQKEISDLQDNRTPLWPYLPIQGGIMTGKITLDADPVSNLHAASKQYVDNLAFAQSGTIPEAPKDGWYYLRGGGTSPTDNNNWSHSPILNVMQIAQSYNTPLFSIGSDAINNYHGFSPSFVDALAFNRTSKILHFLFTNTSVADFSATGINFLQPVTVAADPTINLGVATKQYVDTKVLTGAATIIVSDTPPATPSNNALWWDSVGTQLYLWYNDGNSTQWVNTTNAGFGALNSDAPLDGMLYGRRSGTWSQAATDVSIQNNIGRNVLHNGLFRVAQRGNGPWTTAVYSADRWLIGIATSTATVSLIAQTDAGRAQIGDETSQVMANLVFNGTAGAGDYVNLTQRIEGLPRLAGKTVVVSFWASPSVAGLKLGLTFTQQYGTGGSPSGSFNLPGQSVTLSTTNFARYFLIFNLYSMSGRTLGTNGNDYTQLEFWLSAGSTFATRSGNVGVQSGTINIWGIQCEIAQPGQTQPTPLEKLDYRIDLSNCQRFYQVIPACQSAGYTPGSGALTVPAVTFPTMMRAAPTATFANVSYANGNALTAQGTGVAVCRLSYTSAASGNSWCAFDLALSADL